MIYVERILDRIGPDAVRAGDPVVESQRCGAGVRRTADGTGDRFDAAVMATHADDALRILRDADPPEREALAGFKYTTNRVVLHTERAAATPSDGRAAASWNIDQANCRHPSDLLTMTYDMNRLQALPGPSVLRLGQSRRAPGPGGSWPITRCGTRTTRLRRSTRRRAVKDLQGLAPNVVRRGPLGYGFHEDGCPDRGSPAAAARSRSLAERRRIGRHEVAPAPGRRQASPCPPVHLRARHGVFYARARPRRAGHSSTGRRDCSGATGRARRVPRRRPPDPARHRFRSAFLAHLRPRATIRPAGGSRWSRTCASLGYVFDPASFFLCRDADGVLRVVVVEVHNTHGERHLYTLRPAAGPRRRSSRRWTRRSTCRRSSRSAAATRSASGTSRRGCGSRSTSTSPRASRSTPASTSPGDR